MNNKRFEYLVVDISVTATPAEIENIIDVHQYWELVSVVPFADNLRFFFKRLKTDEY